MIIYVSKKDYRSYGFSPSLWGGEVFKVEVSDDFTGGGKRYDPIQKIWIDDEPYVETEEDKIYAYNQMKIQLIDEAKSTISVWQSELLLDMISDEDKEDLTKWVKYIKAVQNSTYPNELPTKP